MGKASRGKRERKQARTLYHFTSTYHLPLIEAAGFIDTTESNLSFVEERKGPDVVWLMDTPNPDDAPHGLDGSIVDKKAVRITVQVVAEPWATWAKRQPGYDPVQANILIRTGGGPEAAARWWVTEQPIPRSKWLKVESR